MTLPAQQDPAQPPASSAKPDDQPTEHMIPKSRLDAVIQERDEARRKADALEKAQQETERKRLEEANEYKKLYESTQTELTNLKPKAEQVEEMERVLSEQLEAEIATLPEDFKDVVPEGLSTKDKLRWLAKNKSKFMKAEPFDIGAGKRGVKPDKTKELSPEQHAIAQQYGLTDEEYAKHL